MRGGQWCPACGTGQDVPTGAPAGAIGLCENLDCLTALRVAGPIWFEQVSDLALPPGAIMGIKHRREQIRRNAGLRIN